MHVCMQYCVHYACVLCIMCAALFALVPVMWNVVGQRRKKEVLTSTFHFTLCHVLVLCIR